MLLKKGVRRLREAPWKGLTPSKLGVVSCIVRPGLAR